MSSIRNRLKAAGLHLLVSILLLSSVAAIALPQWYPGPYREFSGGLRLLFILVCVDLAVGPLITAAVFDLRKGWPVMRKDLMIIAALQLTALGYGVWSIYEARPVYLVFEYDRFRVLHAADVDRKALSTAPDGYRQLPSKGPALLALRKLSADDRSKFTLDDATGQMELVDHPELWQPYDVEARGRALNAARPVADLYKHFKNDEALIDSVLAGLHRSELSYLPLVDRGETWTVVIDRTTAEPIRYLPLDSF